MPQAFISYQSTDAVFADLVKLRLKEVGIDVWLDHGALRAGEEWRDAIDAGIASSDVLLVVITPNSCKSSYVTYEWSCALGRGIPVIPLLLKQATVHPRLGVLHHLDFVDQRKGPWEKLFREINEAAIVSEHEDHTLAQLEGTYWSGSRHYAIYLSHLSAGLYRIRSADWDGAGVFDGNVYVGFYRYNWVENAPNPSTWGGAWGLHRAVLKVESGSLKLDMIELDDQGVVLKNLRGGTWQRAVGDG